MSLRLLLTALASSALLLAPVALAQDEDERGGALGTAEDIDRNTSPVIIEQRPPPSDEEGAEIRSGRESFVQIPGAWATDEAACASGKNAPNGLYLTNTLIRWESATCNIYNVDSRNGSASLYAQCAGQDGRRQRQFEIEVRGDDTLALQPTWPGATEEFVLRRCPGDQ